MAEDIYFLIIIFITWGWIPTIILILIIGHVIKSCIEAKTCSKCTFNRCDKED